MKKLGPKNCKVPLAHFWGGPWLSWCVQSELGTQKLLDFPVGNFNWHASWNRISYSEEPQQPRGQNPTWLLNTSTVGELFLSTCFSLNHLYTHYCLWTHCSNVCMHKILWNAYLSSSKKFFSDFCTGMQSTLVWHHFPVSDVLHLRQMECTITFELLGMNSVNVSWLR